MVIETGEQVETGVETEDRVTAAPVKSSVQIGGRRMQYLVAGSGPAMVLIHGLVGSGRNWGKNLNALARHRTMYVPDRLCMGESERVPRLEAAIETQADRLVQWMDAVGIARADVAGHSHGGATAMVLAARHPERVGKMVLFAPANPFCTLGHPQIRFYSTWLGGVFARWIIPAMPRVMHLRSLERMYFDKAKIDAEVLAGYTNGLDRLSIAHIVDIMRGWRGDMEAVERALPGVRDFETLVLWGDHDRAVSLESGRELAQRIGAPLQVIEGTGHIAFEEMPETANAAMIAFLRG